MKHYVITKKVILQVGEKEYRKGQTITSDDVGQENINRYLRKGYIELLGDHYKKPAVDDGDIPFYMTAEDFLTPEEVGTLTKPQLVEYAGRIGLTGFKSSIRTDDLHALINAFIDEAIEGGDDDPDDEAGQGGRDPGANNS